MFTTILSLFLWLSYVMTIIGLSIYALSFLPSPVTVVSTECVIMKFLNINALDDLDPVHYRATQNTVAEFDYDGDMGREHSEYLRDNGVGSRQLVAGTFVQIAAALPVIEAPSIVAEIPETQPTKENNNGSSPIGRDAARNNASTHETE